jgi:hypothetical protein
MVADGWAAFDILIHCTILNWEHLWEIERILQNKATWHTLVTSEYVDEFNRVEQEKRRGVNSLHDVLSEWNESFKKVSKIVEQVSDEEWIHQSGTDCWPYGRPMTVWFSQIWLATF